MIMIIRILLSVAPETGSRQAGHNAQPLDTAACSRLPRRMNDGDYERGMGIPMRPPDTVFFLFTTPDDSIEILDKS